MAREVKGQLTCKKCTNAQLRRVNRVGFWERHVLPHLGVYPWECVFCRRRQYRANAGSTRRTNMAAD